MTELQQDWLSNDPVSLWLDELRNADESAASKIWQHFVQRLYESARRKLHPDTRRTYDEEDAVQSAFQSFCTGVIAGRFPDLHDREGLWQLLLVITSRKIAHRHRFDQQLRRDVRRTLPELLFSNHTNANLESIPANEPTAEFTTEFLDVCDSLVQALDDPKLREVARLRMEGYSDREIGEQLDCSRSTVQRRLEIIRRSWIQLEGQTNVDPEQR